MADQWVLMSNFEQSTGNNNAIVKTACTETQQCPSKPRVRFLKCDNCLARGDPAVGGYTKAIYALLLMQVRMLCFGRQDLSLLLPLCCCC